MKRRAKSQVAPEDRALFQQEVRDVRPLPDLGKVVHRGKRPSPLPRQSLRDEREALADSLSDQIPWDAETGEEFSFVRPGLSRQLLRKLRRGHWVIQDELDLHGHTSDTARSELAAFIGECCKGGIRCVRIIHGKGLGSKNREPVLKNKVRHWLTQRDEVLAFCQARPADGGGGAVVALLKSGSRI